METRKVEVFADGKLSYADGKEEHGATPLSIEPIPTLEEIREDPQFKPFEIHKAEFDSVWNRAVCS